MMATKEELQRELARLRARKESQQDIRRIQSEKKDLNREIKALKNPRTAIFKRNLTRGIRAGGRGTMSLIDNLTRPTPTKPTRRRRGR